MTDIVNRFVQQCVVESIEANLAEYSFYLGRAKQGELYDGPDIKWVYSGGPVLNRVFNACFRPAEAEQSITSIQARFKTAKAPVTWLVGPTTQPTRLADHLCDNGFVYRGEWAGMALDLQELPDQIDFPSRLEIRRVADRHSLEMWTQVACNGFQFPASITHAYHQLFSAVSADRDGPFQQYLALYDGEPVGTCSLFLGGGVAGIYWMATVPGARRRGAAIALTWQLLRIAQTLGYRVAVLHSTDMGQHVYHRLGFREYCKIGIYNWDPRPKLVQIAGKISSRLGFTSI